MAISRVVTPRNLKSLQATLPRILDAPKNNGNLDLIVMRPDRNLRETPKHIDLRKDLGLPGDHWAAGSGYQLEGGQPDPDAQICITMSAVMRAIAGPDRSLWAAAGDNLYIDMDLTPANMPPGTRFAIGSAKFIVTALPHNGCQKFIDRYGRDACLFVNTGQGSQLRLRGIYARIIEEGRISLNDRAQKLSAPA